MITRNLSVDDAGRLFGAFQSVQVLPGQENAPDSGFYDYHLTEQDFKQRLFDPRLSIALEDRKDRKLLAYILAYPFYQIPNVDVSHDAVLSQVRAPADAIYVDQFFLSPGLPLHTAGRLVDVWTNHALGYTNEGVVTAIPQKPWKNNPSTRFAISRGFSRAGKVKQGDLELAVFTKPFWRLGDETYDLKIEIGEKGK
jgi:hypothetical protein